MKNTLRNTLNAPKKRKIQQCELPAPTNQFSFKLSIEDRFKELQSEFSVNDLTESMITFDNKIIAPNSQSKKRRKLNDGTASQLYAKSQEDEKFLEDFNKNRRYTLSELNFERIYAILLRHAPTQVCFSSLLK